MVEKKKEYYEKNKEKIKQYYEDNKEKYKARYLKNREKCIEQSSRWQKQNRARYLWLSCRARAKKKGLEFDLEISDIIIPEFCPILGIRIDETSSYHASSTVDRVDSSKGYIKGNIAVISHRANTIKNFGTAEEHRKVADWIEMKLS